MTTTVEPSPIAATGPGIAATRGSVAATSSGVAATSGPNMADRPFNTRSSTPVAATSSPIAATDPSIAATTGPIAATEIPAAAETRHKGLMIPLAVLAVASGLAAALVGFALSYGALRTAAVGWGFGEDWQSYVFPVGVDGLIIALYTIDLVLAWKRMSRPWLRAAAHTITAVTIGLNMAAAAGSAPGSPGLTDALGEHPARLLAHAGMPIAYVLLTEAARWAIVRTAQLEAGAHDQGDRLTLADWALRLPTTWKIYRHAKTWPSTYTEARTHVRDLAVYRIWLKHRQEIEAGLAEDRVGVLDRMPGLLARYGVSVEEARALPALMQERERQLQEDQERADRDRADRTAREHQEQQRRQELQAREDERERQRQAREDAHAERLAAMTAEAEETRLAGELAVLRAETSGAARAAAATAEGAGAAAELEAQTTLAAARRVATEEQRRTAQEEAAEESERTAAARRRAAEHDRVTAATVRAAAEEAARTAKARATEEQQSLLADRDAEEAAALRRTAAAADRDAAAMELAAAETVLRAAEMRARVAHAEALADLTPVQIKTRVVARVLLATPEADGAEIATALGGASPSTASTYRKAALDLIAQGYPETDPDLTSTQQ